MQIQHVALQVVKGLDVLHGIYSGYGDKVNQGRLNPASPGAKEYLASFPQLDSFKSCRVVCGTT